MPAMTKIALVQKNNTAEVSARTPCSSGAIINVSKCHDPGFMTLHLKPQAQPTRTNGRGLSFDVAQTMRANSINNPEHWRKRAEEMRLLADQISDENTKQTMLRIAADYDRLSHEPSNGHTVCRRQNSEMPLTLCPTCKHS